MVVNESKTDLCLFCRQDCPPLVININGKFVISKKTINILGVSFDSKLQWGNQVAQATSRAIKAINAIRLIKTFFTTRELLQLITANAFSVLYYNSEIWHLPSLKTELKAKLMSISAKAIKTSMFHPDPLTSNVNIHRINNRATPEAFMKYKIALQLHKVYNTYDPSLDWISLNFDQILTTRQSTFALIKSNKTRVGLNTLTNRFSILNGKIPLQWLNQTFRIFKIKCKRLFLVNN